MKLVLFTLGVGATALATILLFGCSKPVPTPTPIPTATSEAPSIIATITHLMATPTVTPTPTNTPGPTPTPRAKQSEIIAIQANSVKILPVKLDKGERIVGYYEAANNAVASFSTQDPNGITIKDYGPLQASNFQLTAENAGLYALIFKTRVPNSLEGMNSMFTINYSYEVYGK